MLTRCLPIALLAAAVLPVGVHAEPVAIGVHSVEGGATASLPATSSLGSPTPLGEITLPTATAALAISIGGLTAGTNYLMEVLVHGAGSAWNTLRLEVLDPLDADDELDVAPYHAGVPDGFSASHNVDGLSFAQDAGLQRSAVFAGGSASVHADEFTDRGDVLMFSGVADAPGALHVTFGLRNWGGEGNFLLLVSAGDPVATPEPTSMLLIGTGLAGLAAMRRRRRQSSSQP